jgi:hypothetical protein
MDAPLDLEADWKEIRPRGKRKKKPIEEGFDIHEDWAALKGHPAWAYWVKWEASGHIIVLKMMISGQRKHRDGMVYQARPSKVVFRSPGYGRYDHEIEKETVGYFRHELCFNREEVKKAIQDQRQQYVHSASYEIGRLTHVIDEARKHILGYAKFLKDVAEDPVPFVALAKIPRRASKRLAKDEPVSAKLHEP